MIKLTDAAKINPQARESKYQWAGDRVQLELQNDGVKVQQQVSPSGLFEIPSRRSPDATVSLVYGGRNSRSSYFWRIVCGGGVARRGTPHTVEISNRLRLSLWAFSPPLTSGQVTAENIEIDAGQVDLLKDADVDDLSLVWTITWDTRAKPDDLAKPPKWHNGFTPRGQTSETYRRNYLKGLITALHPKVQVIAGFEIVRKTRTKESEKERQERLAKMTEEEREAEAKAVAEDPVLAARAADFAAWLLRASADDIKKYAQSINEFFEKRGLDVDGIGYDLEFDGLNKSHSDKLALLYRETSDAIGHHNGIVSYANAPFKEDGISSNKFMEPQPFALAATGWNLLARPMCFDGKASTSVPNIEKSIACALRDPADKIKGGAGLHPSQVQFGIWTDRVDGGAEDLCKKVLRPNRIGLLVYSLPAKGPGASNILKKCKEWNAALNPGEGPAGQDAKPLQVPRGFGGWPPPFKSKT